MPALTIRPSAAILIALFTSLLFLPIQAVQGQLNAVEIKLLEIGFGQEFREGSVTGIKVSVMLDPASDLDQATSAVVQWEVPNADGDVAEYRRGLTLTKGAAQAVWLYAPLPPEMRQQTVWNIRVFEYTDNRRGREIGSGRIVPTQRGLSQFDGLIGVVNNQSSVGLANYGLSGGNEPVWSAHERTRVIRGLAPSGLPDHWHGYLALDALVWCKGRHPDDLNLNQVAAIRHWIQGGGHLVIVLPDTLNPWHLGEPATNELADLLPRTAPRREESVSINELLPVLTKSRGLLRQSSSFDTVIQVFRDLGGDFDATDDRYEPVHTLPDGRVVAIQRLYGHGRITLVGIDLTDPRFGGQVLANGVNARLPDTDHFWNRILGRRADVPRNAEIDLARKAKFITRSLQRDRIIGAGALFQEEIKHSEQATKGLLMAALLFVVYWLLAGPAGFFLLKSNGFVRHAWLAFFGAALVFTGIAWGGVWVLRENQMKLRHLTVIDYIARDPAPGEESIDPQLTRATAWLGLYLPGYGSTAVGFKRDEAPGSRQYQRELLTSWTPPPVGSGQYFPNVDRYSVDVGGDAMRFNIPRRSTATELHAQWMGGLDPAFGMIVEDPDDPIHVQVEGGREILYGSLINKLQGPLHDVHVFWTRSSRIQGVRFSVDGPSELAWSEVAGQGKMLNVGDFWKIAGPWEPGSRHSVGDVVQDGRMAGKRAMTTMMTETFAKPYRGAFGGPGGGTPTANERVRQLVMLSCFEQLTPPRYLRSKGDTEEDVVFKRMMGRELDLSPWFSGPCLIVVGFLHGAACPIPFTAAGEEVASEGMIMVRWIMPLDLVETAAFRSQLDETVLQRLKTGDATEARDHGND